MGQVVLPVFLVRVVLLGDRQSVGPEWGQGEYSDSGQAESNFFPFFVGKNGALDTVQKSVCVQVGISMWVGDLPFSLVRSDLLGDRHVVVSSWGTGKVLGQGCRWRCRLDGKSGSGCAGHMLVLGGSKWAWVLEQGTHLHPLIGQTSWETVRLWCMC